MDFIMGLLQSQGFTTILVVVERFTKGAHFGALPTNYTTYKIALFFLDIVCKLHGFPYSLVSDHDPIFISKFWKELFCLNGTKLRMSMSYHLKTDDQTEFLNRILEQYLRAFVHGRLSHWFRFFTLVGWSYNTLVHSATSISPFEDTYGKPPLSIFHYLQGTSQVEAVDSLLSISAQIHSTLQHRLAKT